MRSVHVIRRRRAQHSPITRARRPFMSYALRAQALHRSHVGLRFQTITCTRKVSAPPLCDYRAARFLPCGGCEATTGVSRMRPRCSTCHRHRPRSSRRSTHWTTRCSWSGGGGRLSASRVDHAWRRKTHCFARLPPTQASRLRKLTDQRVRGNQKKKTALSSRANAIHVTNT